MKKYRPIKNETLTGERALFRGRNLQIENCLFDDGESPLKESKNIVVTGSTFGWKYPVWYSENVKIEGCVWRETGRAGVWYTKNISVKDCCIDAPKNFRRCRNLTITNATFPLAEETLWACDGVRLENVTIEKGNYFGMNSRNIVAENLTIDGNYSFDGAKNVYLKNSVLNSKDAFWNSRNVTCENCVIVGEYLGWNAKNLTFINCSIDSLQGLCYIDGLKLVNCDLKGTTLSFEFCSKIDAEVNSHIISVKNPISGKIRAKSIGELILDENIINPCDTEISTEE